MNRQHLFPSPVWQDQLDNKTENDELIKIAYQMRDADPVGADRSNVGGYHSVPFQNIPIIQNHIMNMARLIVAEYGFEEEPEMQSAWFNINGPNSVNSQHNHPQAFLSGVYHVKANEQSGPLRFHRNPSDAFIIQSMSTITELNQLNSPIAVVPAIPGQLLIFPAWLMHSVDPNKDKEDRISIAFNISL